MSDITDQLIVSRDNGIGFIQLDNQAKRNAMTFDMWQGIPKVLDDFEADDAVRVVVVSAAAARPSAPALISLSSRRTAPAKMRWKFITIR